MSVKPKVACCNCTFMRHINDDFVRAIKTCTNPKSPHKSKRFAEEAIQDGGLDMGCDYGETNAAPK